MKLHPHLDHKQVGNLYELLVASKLIQLGCLLSFPYGENCLYDMIADYCGQLYKIQVKAPYVVSEGVYAVSCVTTNNTTKSRFHGYSRNDVDLICSVVENELICLSPQLFENRQVISIRSNDSIPRNNQTKNIRYIKDLTFDNALQQVNNFNTC